MVSAQFCLPPSGQEGGTEVRLAWLGATFMRRFAVKIEAAAGETTIRIHTLLRPSHNHHIIGELDERHETQLTDLW